MRCGQASVGLMPNPVLNESPMTTTLRTGDGDPKVLAGDGSAGPTAWQPVRTNAAHRARRPRTTGPCLFLGWSMILSFPRPTGIPGTSVHDGPPQPFRQYSSRTKAVGEPAGSSGGKTCVLADFPGETCHVLGAFVFEGDDRAVGSVQECGAGDPSGSCVHRHDGEDLPAFDECLTCSGDGILAVLPTGGNSGSRSHRRDRGDLRGHGVGRIQRDAPGKQQGCCRQRRDDQGLS